MLLKDILPDRPCQITYRTFLPWNEDTLAGLCRWDGKELISLDGDTYSTDDRILKYETDPDGSLTVWYESQWIS